MLTAYKRGAAYTSIRDSASVKSCATGVTDRHYGLLISLWKASPTCQYCHDRLDLDWDHSAPVNTDQLPLDIANRT